MTDVRLTATNPADSSVVPVACNEKGELKLEEPIVSPPFDGNLDGDLDVSGSITADGSATFEGFVNAGGASHTSIGLQATNTSTTIPALWVQNSNGGTGPLLQGYNSGAKTVEIFNNGSAVFSGFIESKNNFFVNSISADQACFRTIRGDVDTSMICGDGSASFAGDVVIGSRGAKWLIRESNGVAMLVEQTRRQPREIKVRDLPNELDLVEAALNEVMTRLKMTPPAGRPAWDGSDISGETDTGTP